MASKKQQKAGFPLPDPVTGYDLIDVCLKIPDAPEYRRAFLGHINQLGQWFMWEKSYLPGDTRAKEAAELWRRVLFDHLHIGDDCMSCCCDDPPALYRYNADGQLERSTDGGETWTAAPGFDPRNTATQYPPLPGADGDDKKCQAATNIRVHTKEQADKLAADAGAWGGVSDMIAALLAILFFIGVFGTLGTMTPLLVAFAGAILYAGQAAFDAAMTSDVYNTFQCIVYCHIEADGSFTDADIAAIISDIQSQLTGIAVDFLVHTVTVLGKIGLANMGKTASGTTGDCSSCDCGTCGSNWSAGYYFEGVLQHADSLDEQGDGYIIVNSYDRGDGVQTAVMTAPTSADGCWFAWTFLDHTPSVPAPFKTACDVVPSYENRGSPNYLMPNPTNGTSFWIESTSGDSAVPFRLRLDFDTTACV